MTYLLIGENTQEKNDYSNRLREQYSSKESLQFDYEVLYGNRLSPQDLKKALWALPAVAAVRLVIVHECEKLNETCLNVIVEFQKLKSAVVLILQTETALGRDGVWGQIRSQAQVYEITPSVKNNVFGMMRNVHAGQPVEALKILDSLIADGIHPLQIMGGIVWAWGNERQRMPLERFERGLREIQQSDLNIKRSRLTAQSALEVLIVKLADIRK